MWNITWVAVWTYSFQFECIVLGIAPLVARHYKYQFLFSFLIWTVALALFIVCGSFLPVRRVHMKAIWFKSEASHFYCYPLKLDLTLDVVVLFVLAVVSIIGAIYFVMLYIVANVAYSFIIARCFIVISILMVSTESYIFELVSVI